MGHPAQIGRYQVLAELGAGAMGSVYLARDTVLGREVALKTCRLPDIAAPEELRGLRARLLHEARSAAAISHPHVVTVYDVVELDAPPMGSMGPMEAMGSVYIAMEYVPGTSLEERLASGPLGAPEALRIFEQLADALDFVHQRGFVHRDIKPSNVLLDRDGQVKLADFGIAQPRNQDDALDGSLFGTPQYMAPEQILGMRTDARTDVFACGVLLFEVLSGRKPFAGDTVADVARHTLTGELVAPEGLVFGLAPVLRRALAREPDERYPSAGALVQAMRQALREDPDATLVTTTTAAAAGGGSRSAPTGRWLAAALAGAALAAVTAGTVIYQRMAAAAEDRAREVGYARLISEGLAKIDADDPQAAVVLFSTAQKLSRDSVEAKSLVALAQRRVAQAAAVSEANREAARSAPPSAPSAPSGPPATAAAAAAPAARAAVNPRAGDAEPAARGDAVLIVDVVSETPAGTLVIFRGNRQILRLPFDFYEPAGWFRRRPTGGHHREEISLEPGRAILRVLLARRDEPGVISELPLELAAGERRVLELRVPATGKPEVRLESRVVQQPQQPRQPPVRPEPPPGTPRSSAAGPSAGPRRAAA